MISLRTLCLFIITIDSSLDRLREYPRSELTHTHPTVNNAFFFLFVTGHLTKKICTYFANVQISMNNPCTFATLNPKTHRCIHTLFESQSKN